MPFDYNFRSYNIRLVLYVFVLNIVGVLVIRSATNQDMTLVNKQIMGIVIGLMVVIGLSLLDYHWLLSLSALIYVICIAGLVAVLFFGNEVGGATRWIVLPWIGQLQPSEFVKIGLVLFFADYLGKRQEVLNRFRTLVLAAALILLPLFLIFSEPDLSTSLVILVVFCCMLFTAGLSYRWILGATAMLIPCGAVFVYLLQYNMVPLLRNYQAGRIRAFFDRGAEYAEANLQQNNSIMAIDRKSVV